jgi:O-antigen ligase
MSAAIIRDHPVIGVGTGGFAAAYAEQVTGSESRQTTNPHQDYLLIGVQIGLVGIAALIALYALAWRQARRLRRRLHRDMLRGIVIVMVLGGLFNSLLHDHTEGLLFAWLMGVMCAGRSADRYP